MNYLRRRLSDSSFVANLPNGYMMDLQRPAPPAGTTTTSSPASPATERRQPPGLGPEQAPQAPAPAQAAAAAATTTTTPAAATATTMAPAPTPVPAAAPAPAPSGGGGGFLSSFSSVVKSAQMAQSVAATAQAKSAAAAAAAAAGAADATPAKPVVRKPKILLVIDDQHTDCMQLYREAMHHCTTLGPPASRDAATSPHIISPGGAERRNDHLISAIRRLNTGRSPAHAWEKPGRGLGSPGEAWEKPGKPGRSLGEAWEKSAERPHGLWFRLRLVLTRGANCGASPQLPLKWSDPLVLTGRVPEPPQAEELYIWAKYFRGKKLNGDYEIRVEQAEFSEINLASYVTSGCMVDMQATRGATKVVR
ncbi:hypothetical protein CRUP_016305 [Coryphaenoides rupestris]|nr:hypothetical protein CRUP_016305 [Coryphaenoides rupestris]